MMNKTKMMKILHMNESRTLMHKQTFIETICRSINELNINSFRSN